MKNQLANIDINKDTNPIVLIGIIEMQKEIIRTLKGQIKEQGQTIRDLSSSIRMASTRTNNMNNVYNLPPNSNINVHNR